MKTRLLLFCRDTADSNSTGGQILFARTSDTLLVELPEQLGVEDFAQKLGLKRHSKFDWSVGEMGRKATLLESQVVGVPSLQLDAAHAWTLTWDNFRNTAVALKDGQDRRFLQLAVQFLASGAEVDDSVVAADYDAEFLQTLQKALANKDSSETTSGKDSGDN
jgi:hypothetical protein